MHWLALVQWCTSETTTSTTTTKNKKGSYALWIQPAAVLWTDSFNDLLELLLSSLKTCLLQDSVILFVGYAPLSWCYGCTHLFSSTFTWYYLFTMESVDEILWCYHSKETSWAVLSHDTIYLVWSSNVWICGWNPMVLPFRWNLFSRTFTWYYLFSI